MLHVSDIYSMDLTATGTHVQVSGILLGTSFDDFVVADSIEHHDRGVAVPVLDDDLLERLVMNGVYGIGGGRFAYRYQSAISAILASGVRGYKFALKDIVTLTVHYRGKEVLIKKEMGTA